MKKVLTLFAAVVLFATAAMAKDIDLTGHRFTHYAGETEQGSGEYVIQYGLKTSVGTFYFTFDGTVEPTLGEEYNLSQMNADYSFVDFGEYVYGQFSAATFTKVDSVNFTASATCDDGNTYNIVIAPLTPIDNPIDTVVLNISEKTTCRLTDYTATSGAFQLSGSNAEKSYYFYMTIYSEAIPGAYTANDIYADYTALYNIDGSEQNEIELNNLIGDINVAGDATNGITATVNWVGTDSVLYQITFAYADPVATTPKTFSATNLVVAQNAYYEMYVAYGAGYPYDFEASNAEYILVGSIVAENEPIYGTYDVADLDAAFYDATTQMFATEPFSGSMTLAAEGDGVKLTSTSTLCYGDIMFTIDALGTIETAVENVETSNYAVLSQKNGVVVVGAEGEVISLYDMAGRMIQTVKAASDNVRLDVAIPGVYVIKVNGEAIRAIVK